MRRGFPYGWLSTGLAVALTVAGCAGGTDEPGPAPSAAASDNAAAEDPCAAEPAEDSSSELPHRDEVPLPEWWADQIPLPECGTLVLAEQSGKDIELEYEYETTDAAMADAEALIAELEKAGYAKFDESEDEDQRVWHYQYEETPGEWAGVDVDLRLLTESNHLIGTARWPYPYLEVSYYDYR